MKNILLPKAPLFRDPLYDGAADPTIIWNYELKEWWLIYTSRRANIDCPSVAWCHGTEIGIASSSDGGQNWVYRGTMNGLEFERGKNTFWAPEILWHDGVYHMYVSYVPGVPSNWSGIANMVHFTSSNLWNWTFVSRLVLSSDSVIDACVFRLKSGKWRMWYKDGVHSHTYAADSNDLYNWRVVGPIITDCNHEGPNVFHWKDSYWMLTDPWMGLGVYKSDDAENWVRQNNIMAQPGQRKDDGSKGGHADVLVQGDEAFVFYFTHPERSEDYRDVADETNDIIAYKYRRSSIQVAQLQMEDGKLICDRDRPFHFQLNPL